MQLKNGGIGVEWCQVLDGFLAVPGVVREIKNHLWWKGLCVRRVIVTVPSLGRG